MNNWFELTNLELSVLDTDLRGAAAARLGLKPEEIRSVRILRRSIDARQHQNVRFQYQLAVETPEGFRPPAAANAQSFADESDALQEQIEAIRRRLEGAKMAPGRMPVESGRDAHAPVSTGRRPQAAELRPVIVGAGPAGLFAALAFTECGLRPVIVERGRPAEERAPDVERFWGAGELDPESNMYFGEGGAGTFSDGKLNTRSKNPAVTRILRELAACGAPEEILYDAKPHIGTDRLVQLLPRLRQRLIAAGATFLFNTRLDDIRRTPGGALEARLVSGAAAPRTAPSLAPPSHGHTAAPVSDTWIPANPLVVACGHSAFDTWRLLLRRGVPFAPKPTAIGCRMEHPAEFVTRHFFGKDQQVLAVLGNAPYNLAVPVAAGAASAYSFCCCPGGEVVSCAAAAGLVSVNGMSYSRRDSPFTNAGLVTSVSPEEMVAAAPQHATRNTQQEAQIESIFAWREALERRCFEMGGGAFGVPGQTASDFAVGRATTRGLRTSSRRPVVPADFASLLPPQVAERLREGLRAMDRKIPGWIRFGALLGVETTTSSPVRIVRTPQGGCEGWPELLPVGEGSGYAGGIVTSALDGHDTVLRWLSAPAG